MDWRDLVGVQLPGRVGESPREEDMDKDCLCILDCLRGLGFGVVSRGVSMTGCGTFRLRFELEVRTLGVKGVDRCSMYQ